MNKFCTECGSPTNPGDQFCVSCGAATSDSAPVPIGVGASSAEQRVAPSGQTTGSPALPAASLSSSGINTNAFVTRATQALSRDLIRRSAGLVTAVWVGMWVLLLITAALFGSASDTGSADVRGIASDIGSPTVASILMLLGFGGSLTAHGSINAFVAQGELGVWFRLVPFVIPLAYALILRKAHRTISPDPDRPRLATAGAVAAVTAALLVVVTRLFAGSSVAVSGWNALDLGVSWFLPAIIAAVITFVAVVGLDLLRSPAPLQRSLRELSTVLLSVTGLVVVGGAIALVVEGFKSGTGAVSTTAVDLIGATVGFLLALPNTVAVGLAALTGAQLGQSGANADVVARLQNNAPDTGSILKFLIPAVDPDNSTEPVGLPLWAQLLTVIVLVVALLALWNRRRQQPSVQAWWRTGVIFAATGLLLTYFGNAVLGFDLSIQTVGGSGAVDGQVGYGFNPIEVAARFAVLGAIIGLTRHPAVIALMQPVGEPVSRFFEFGIGKVRRLPQWLGFGKLRRHLTSPTIGGRKVELGRGAAVAAIAVVLVLLVPVSIVFGKAASAATGAVGDSADDVMGQVKDAMVTGNGATLSKLAGYEGESAILSSHGVNKVDAVYTDNQSDHKVATLTWTTSDGQVGTGTVTIAREDGQPEWGLFPHWTVSSIEGLPTILGVTTVNGTVTSSDIQVSGAKVGTFATAPTVMPGQVDVAGISANPKWLAASVASPTTVAVKGSVEVPVTYTVTAEGKSVATQTAKTLLSGCRPGSVPASCPTDFCAWIAPGPNGASYGNPVATGSNTMSVTPTNLTYKYESYSGCDSEDTYEYTYGGTVYMTFDGQAMNEVPDQ